MQKIAQFTKKTKNILEIGSGTGNLTKYFLTNQKKYLIEIDKRITKENFNNLQNLLFKNADATKINKYEDEIDNYFNKMKYLIVGNLPYHACKVIIRNCLYLNNWTNMIFLLESEFVKTIINKNKKSFFQNFINCFGTVQKLLVIDKNKFSPVPKVNSTLIEIKRNDKTKNDLINPNFILFIKNCFRYPRKTLNNNLRIYNKKNISIKKIYVNKISNLLNDLNLNQDVRADKLSLNNLYFLFKKLIVKND